MRIRKGQLPFPLSSSSPLPLSDPHLIHRPPLPLVQLNDSPTPLLLQQTATASRLDHPHPPDPPLPPIRKPIHAWDSSAIATESSGPRKQDPSDEDGRERDGGGEKRNDTRKGGILGSDTASEVVPLSSPSNQGLNLVDGRWWEGETAIPLKKRRRGLERRGVGDYMAEDNGNNNKKKKKMKTRMKTKMNKKCSSTQDDNEEDEEEMDKKSGRGSAVMEGSRCSRVNGRGWRCCQQTLVGYSLCEHHLGKGRLRSITSVRTPSAPTTTTTATSKNEPHPLRSLEASSSSPERKSKLDDSLGIDIGEDKDEKKPLMTTKKRVKLGMVKARSISSLLGQTNTQITVSETQDNE